MIPIVLIALVFHIIIALMLIDFKLDTCEFDKMSYVEWARYKFKCYFWEIFAPYFIIKWIIYAAQEVYDTVTTALRKNETKEKK